MSASLYDKALLKKIQNWTHDTDVHITGVEESRRLFEVIADQQNDKPITLPLIAIRRPGGYVISNKQKQPMSFRSLAIAKNNQGVVTLNAIPIDISYQIDIYTRYLEECDEYCRNFVFNLINYPQLDIEIPYHETNMIHHANVKINSDVEDNSSVPERLIPGQFTRMSIGIDIDDAYIWDVNVNTTKREIVGFDTTF